MKVVDSKPISYNDAKDILTKRKKLGELESEQQAALEYLENFTKHTPAQCKKLIDGVVKNDKVPVDIAIKLVDVAPSDPELVKTILLKEQIELSDDEVGAIVKLFAK